MVVHVAFVPCGTVEWPADLIAYCERQQVKRSREYTLSIIRSMWDRGMACQSPLRIVKA